MYSFATYKNQYKANLKLALPVVLTQLGQILTQFADNLMVGRYGGDDPTPLAAVSFGGAVFFILFIAAIGIALGMTPLVGELYAQGDREKSAGLLQNGILFYGLLGLAMAVVQYAAIPLLYHLGQPAEVVDMAIPYYKMLVYSMPFIMLFFTFKQFLEGVGNTKVEMVVTIVANLANIGFNWVFIYGRYGFPEMGAEGAGLGTLMSRIIAPIGMVAYFYSRHKYRAYLDGFSPRNYSWATVKKLLHMGLPISMQMFLEASAFVGTGIMMGWFNKETMSANQIATTIGNCAFMIVMSIGAATTIRVSHCYGARNIGELSLAAVKFGQNILAENNNYALVLASTDLDGIPSNVRDQAREKAEALGEKGKYAFTLHKPSLIPFLTYSSKRELREQIYKAYLNRCNNGDEYDNKQLINDFIRLRTEKAHLLGYPSYAAYVVADEMAGTTDAVYKLLDEIWAPALESAKGELAEMEVLFKKDFPEGEFASWDWWYYAEKVRKQKYELDEEMLRPYFSLENVQGGIFFLANRLYGITFRPVIVPLYHPDATAYEVLDADESHLGVLYFDYFPRDGKSQGAWCGNYVEQTYRDGKRVAPVVSIVCNFTRPTSNSPALLTLDETETLFHEFGHALHFLFHDVKYRGLTEVEGDFVELPSQLMENWAFEPELLKQYAVNYRSKDAVIPEYLVAKLRRSELFNQGFMTTELIAAALSDMDIHSTTEYAPFDPMEFERQALTEKRGLIPQIEPRYRYPYFSHIFDGGYSAGYYFYTWAEVLDKDAFEAFRESGDLFNKKIADDFRRKILARGGSEDGMTMYRAFRGKDPDKRAMLRSRGLWNEPEPEPADSLGMPIAGEELK